MRCPWRGPFGLQCEIDLERPGKRHIGKHRAQGGLPAPVEWFDDDEDSIPPSREAKKGGVMTTKSRLALVAALATATAAAAAFSVQPSAAPEVAAAVRSSEPVLLLPAAAERVEPIKLLPGEVEVIALYVDGIRVDPMHMGPRTFMRAPHPTKPGKCESCHPGGYDICLPPCRRGS